MRKRLATAWFRVLAPCALVGGGTALFLGYLLRRFPYNGLYGVDAYAYYFQARALLDAVVGKARDPNALFDANGLGHWPVGYHLHIIAGFLFGGEGIFGPHLLTVAMAVLCPLVVYGLFGLIVLPKPWAARLVGGAVAAAVLPLSATYTRTGLSLMSDIPSLFWTLLALYSLLKVYPSADAEALPLRNKRLWSVAFGAALGLAILTRYGSGLIVFPVVFYYVARRWHGKVEVRRVPAGWNRVPAPLYSLAAFLLAFSPQILYLAAHSGGGAAGEFISAMNPGNIFAYSSSGPDGVATFPQSMAGFYLFNPFWDTAGGFLSLLFVPIVLVGLLWLVWYRRWALLLLLVSWWLLPGLVYASTPYQAHRFALLYLPAIGLLIGLGVAAVVQPLAKGIADRNVRVVGGVSIAVLIVAALLVLGSAQCWRSVRDWVGTHAQWQAQDEQVAAVALSAAAAAPGADGQPSAISFGATAALYYYTQWPVLELYNTNAAGVERFVEERTGLGPVVVVVPLQSLQTQWQGQPLESTWSWLDAHYALSPEGTSGAYTIFLLRSKQ